MLIKIESIRCPDVTGLMSGCLRNCRPDNPVYAIKRTFRYGEGRTRLYKKHPHRWKNLFGYDITILIYSLYIIFSLKILLAVLYFIYTYSNNKKY